MAYEREKLGVLAQLFRMIIDIYGDKEAKHNLRKNKGREMEFYFASLNGGIVFKATEFSVSANVGESADPITRVIIFVPEDEIVDTFLPVFKYPPTIYGWTMLIFRYLIPFVITRKIKIKGSWLASLRLFRCVMGVIPRVEKETEERRRIYANRVQQNI